MVCHPPHSMLSSGSRAVASTSDSTRRGAPGVAHRRCPASKEADPQVKSTPPSLSAAACRRPHETESTRSCGAAAERSAAAAAWGTPRRSPPHWNTSPSPRARQRSDRPPPPVCVRTDGRERGRGRQPAFAARRCCRSKVMRRDNLPRRTPARASRRLAAAVTAVIFFPAARALRSALAPRSRSPWCSEADATVPTAPEAAAQVDAARRGARDGGGGGAGTGAMSAAAGSVCGCE